MLFPQGLTPWYPHPGSQLGLTEVVFSAVVVLGLSAGAYRLRRTQPYLLIGWLWYLGMLFPVIGLVQRGEQARCDRYTYLSQIGLYIMIAWGVAELAARLRWPRRVVAIGASVVLIALMACAYVQAGYWRNSETLWKHTLAHTSRNYVAHLNLAVGLAESNRLPEALPHFQQALQIRPTSPEAQNNYGYALASTRRVIEALPYYQEALRLKPDFVNALLNLGDALTALGRANEARTYYAAAEKILGKPQGPGR
jgi:tetratricopeptide (TPR) repeat protein